MPKILHEKWLWCVEKKKIREITGYTLENEEKNFESWYRCAIAFYDAAIVLYKNKAELSRGAFAADFNAALSIEIMLKAIMVRKGMNYTPTHNLYSLFSKANISISDDQKYMIDYLTECIIWFKYPVPKNKDKDKAEKQWDKFNDETFEGLVLRDQEGTVRANRERLPSLDNYTKLWNILSDKYKGYKTCDT